MSLVSQITALVTRIGNEMKLKMVKSQNLSDVANRQTALNNLTNVANATNGHVLSKDPATGNAIYQVPTVADNSVNYVKTGTEFKGDLTITANAIDWATGFYKAITLTANTTFTFTNLEKGKTILLKVTGSYTLTLPGTVTVVNGGTYDGTKQNFILLTCFDTSAVLATINK